MLAIHRALRIVTCTSLSNSDLRNGSKPLTPRLASGQDSEPVLSSNPFSLTTVLILSSKRLLSVGSSRKNTEGKVKVKDIPALFLTEHHAVKACNSTHSLTSELGDEWSDSRPNHFTPRQRAPGTHWIGG